MKICPRCSTECEDNVIFCISCGLKFEKPATAENNETIETIEPKEAQPQIIQSEPPPPQVIFQSEPPTQPPPQYQPQPQPQYQQPAYGYAQPAPLPQTPATDLLKRASSSPLFLVFVLAYSLVVALQLFSLVTTNYGYGIDTIQGVASIVSGAITWVLSALTMLGLWMHFAAAKNKKIPGMKTSGLTLLKVCTIITFVYLCIGMVLIGLALLLIFIAVYFGSFFVGVLLLIFIALYFGSFFGALIGIIAWLFGNNIGISSIGPVIVCIIGGIYVIAAIFVIIYYVKIFKSIKAATLCAKTGSANYKMSSFVPVVNFIIVLFYLVSLIFAWTSTSIASELLYNMSGYANDFVYQSMGIPFILTIAQTVLNAIVLVTISVAMFAYNAKLTALNRVSPHQAYGQR